MGVRIPLGVLTLTILNMLYFFISSVVFTFLFMYTFKETIKEQGFDDTVLSVLFILMIMGMSWLVWLLVIVFHSISPIGKLLRKYYIGGN